MKFLYLALGGSIGAISRYLITLFAIRNFNNQIYSGTMLVNVVGSFAIGLAFVILGREQIPPNLKIVLFVGVFGSFTTFSSFMFEALDLARFGDFKAAMIYLFMTNLLGLIAVVMGYELGKYVESYLR
jgi:CrcB protein